VSQFTSATEARHYRDDGPLVDLLGRVKRPGEAASAALPLTVVVLLPLLALASVPGEHAPVVLAVTTLVAAAGNARAQHREHSGLFDWLVPPLLRLGEYAALLRLTAVVAPDAVPACYALLAALAYHHYDVVYRLRDRGELPPRWLRWFGLGWEGRLLAAALLAHLGLLASGLLVAAVVLGVVYVTDGVLGWLRSERHAAVDAGLNEAEA
jgi:hypothetical protein